MVDGPGRVEVAGLVLGVAVDARAEARRGGVVTGLLAAVGTADLVLRARQARSLAREVLSVDILCEHVFFVVLKKRRVFLIH